MSNSLDLSVLSATEVRSGTWSAQRVLAAEPVRWVQLHGAHVDLLSHHRVLRGKEAERRPLKDRALVPTKKLLKWESTWFCCERLWGELPGFHWGELSYPSTQPGSPVSKRQFQFVS